jgi:5-methylcytosine-specific restriction endonuclease McrA
MKPSAEEQLDFLQHIQRLFEDGGFVATYKYALLMSLAELAVESDVDNAELPLSMLSIAEKFAELYWPQTIPYVSGTAGAKASVLSQNLGLQASIVNHLDAFRLQGAASITQAKRLPGWQQAIRRIASIVSIMPVQHLQYVGRVLVPFLYEYPHPPGKVLLKPRIAFMLRTFHPLIQQLARAGWVRHIRENRRNASVIGQADGLEAFMFGSSRNALVAASQVLVKIQSGKCFYCDEKISMAGDVDHFIPWSKYPCDLAHNLVLAHAKCNRSKSDMLAAESHLQRWLERNRRFGSEISCELSGLLTDCDRSNRVALWAYERGLTTGAHGWIKSKLTEPLNATCLELLVSPDFLTPAFLS